MDEQQIRQAIYLGISEGMRDGAAHIAEALAGKDDTKDSIAKDQLWAALRIVVESNTTAIGGGVTIGRTGRVAVGEQIAAWTVLRKALNLPV